MRYKRLLYYNAFHHRKRSNVIVPLLFSILSIFSNDLPPSWDQRQAFMFALPSHKSINSNYYLLFI